jgi:hypothetical protein
VGSDGSTTFSSQPYTSLRESSFHSIVDFDGGDGWSASGALISSWRQGQPVVDDLARLQLDEIPGAIAIFDPRRFTLAYSTLRIAGIGLVDELQSAVWYNGYREARTFRRSDWQRTVFDDDLLQTGGARLEAKFRPLGNHSLTLEADAQVESTNAERWEARDDGSVWGQRGRFPDDSRSRFVGITLSDRWRLDERMSATASARWNHRVTRSDYGPSQFGQTGMVGFVDRHYGGISWRAAVERNWEAGWKVSASIASSFRSPGLDEQVANAFWINGRDVPNPALRPEQATEAELAGRMDRDGVSIGVSVYRTGYRDLIRRNWFEPGPDGTAGTTDDLFRFTNTRSASVTGADIDASLLPGAFLGFRTELSARAGIHVWHSPDSGVQYYLPPVVGRASARFDRGSIWFEPFVRFSSAAPAVEYAAVGVIADDTSGWTTVNVRGGVRLGRELFLGVAVENVMNARYVEHGSHILGPGRNLVLSGSYRF